MEIQMNPFSFSLTVALLHDTFSTWQCQCNLRARVGDQTKVTKITNATGAHGRTVCLQQHALDVCPYSNL